MPAPPPKPVARRAHRPTAPPALPTLAGSVLAGRYRLERSVGRGGFAEVYLGRHQEIESLRVAIKILHGVHRQREIVLDRFRREASVLAMLRNRHTVRLIDFGFTHDALPFLVMEFVEGAPLDRVIRANGALRPGDAARIGIGVLKALAEAHSFGVVHRDLKPGNIFLVPEPGEHHVVTRVLDFGIAKVMGDPRIDRPAPPVGGLKPDTEGDVVFCTPLYAAPELLRGQPDFRTDLYALGLVMAEILDGTPPYVDQDCSIDVSPHLSPDAVPLGPATLASPLADVIVKATRKDVSRRYQSAAEMLADLEAAYAAFCSPDLKEQPLILDTALPDITPPPPLPGGASRFVPVTRRPATTTQGRLATILRDEIPELEVPAPPISTLAREFDSGYTPTAMIALAGTERRRRRVPVAVAVAAGLMLVTVTGFPLAHLLSSARNAEPTSEPEQVPAEVAIAPVEAAHAQARAVIEFDADPMQMFAVATARAAVSDAFSGALSSLVRIRSTAPATVRVDGELLAALVPDGNGTWHLPPGSSLPVRRPLQLALVGPGILVSHEVTQPGPVDLDLDLAALLAAEDVAVVVPEAAAPATRRRSSASPAPQADPEVTTPAISSPTRLGPPVAPRTR